MYYQLSLTPVDTQMIKEQDLNQNGDVKINNILIRYSFYTCVRLVVLVLIVFCDFSSDYKSECYVGDNEKWNIDIVLCPHHEAIEPLCALPFLFSRFFFCASR